MERAQKLQADLISIFKEVNPKAFRSITTYKSVSAARDKFKQAFGANPEVFSNDPKVTLDSAKNILNRVCEMYRDIECQTIQARNSVIDFTNKIEQRLYQEIETIEDEQGITHFSIPDDWTPPKAG
ncbi:hypothetical protein ACI2KR_27440 [Pseudomonas luteola]